MLGSPGRLTRVGNVSLNAIKKILNKIGLGYLANNVVYMLYPNDPSRSEGNRHYLYTPTGGWALSGTMTGTMDAYGDVTGGTFAMSVPAGTVDMVSYWGTPLKHTKFPFLSIGFNRSLTAGEIASFTSALSTYATAAGVTPATASVTFKYGYSTKYPTITGTTYYVDPVDGNDANAGTAPGAGNAWKTVAKVNGFAFNAGDGVLFKGGNTYTTALKPTASGTSTAPIVFGAYGVAGSTPPIINAASPIQCNGKSGLMFRGLVLRGSGAQVTAQSNESYIWLLSCIFESAGTFGFYGSANAAVVIDGCVFSRPARYPIYCSGASTITARNCVILPCVTSSDEGPYSIGTGGSLDIDYSIVNTLVTPSTTRVTYGSNNITRGTPGFTSYPPTPAVTPRITFTVDDTANLADFSAFCSGVLDPLGLKATIFVSPAGMSAGDQATCATLAAAGHEIANHTLNHEDLSATNAFTVTSTNTNPTVDVDVATTTIAFSCDEVGNRVTFDWSGGKTLTDLKAAVAGKGWTLTNSVENGKTRQNGLLIDSLADTSGAQAVPYTCALDISATSKFWDHEINDATTQIAAITGVTPTTMAYPYGFSTANLRTWLAAHTSLLAARTVGGAVPSLASVPQWLMIQRPYLYTASSTEADVRKIARAFLAFGASCPSYNIFYDHAMSSDLRQRHAWFINEFVTLGGGTLMTFGALAAWINADHTLSSGTWTKTYDVTGADYTPSSGSAMLTVGNPSAPHITVDALGTSAPVFSSIGAVQK